MIKSKVFEIFHQTHPKKPEPSLSELPMNGWWNKDTWYLGWASSWFPHITVYFCILLVRMSLWFFLFTRKDKWISRDGHSNVTYYFLVVRLSAAVCGGQCGRTLFQVPRLLPTLGRAADGDGVDAVGVAVTGTVVFAPSTVSWSPDKNRAEASSPLFTNRKS